MFFAKGTTDLMQRLPRLPTTPHVDLLLRGKPKPFPWLPLKAALYQMVLHRPFEPAGVTGEVDPYYEVPEDFPNKSRGDTGRIARS